MDPLLERHIARCNNAVLPGNRLPFLIGCQLVGWVKPQMADALAAYDAIVRGPDRVTLKETMAGDLPAIAEGLADRALFRFRHEEFDVRADPEGDVLARVDRGALPQLGIMSVGVHLNGLVRRADGIHVWVGHRAMDKPLDPGKLDQIVAGGVPAGMTPEETLTKEAEEEAGMSAALVANARHVARVTYAHERAEGLRRDLLHCYDIDLPDNFMPHSNDGEVDRFELWPIGRVYETVRDTDQVKFNVNLVLIDLFQRLGMA
ncbi:MAG TPA: DUF4743 domain-containing protein [Acetobacteraceae bacterium]|nr:DUF4743 domain-containing protein [Acetobacteraceae bacterium]